MTKNSRVRFILVSPTSLKLIEKKKKTMMTKLACHDENGIPKVIFKPGDKVVLKEACKLIGQFWRYKADYTEADIDSIEWLPPHKMPLSAVRYNLIVKSVRLQRLKDITLIDALKEGVSIDGARYRVPEVEQSFRTHRGAFSVLWNKTTAHRWKSGANVLWRHDPLVWKIEFQLLDNKTKS